MPSYNEKFQNLFNKLNPEQKDAVDNIDGPVLVIAGPGTGKTQVLTMRIANILTKTDTPPDAILALTFTESGVRAMKERLLSIIGSAAYYVNIHTFHSFASDIIRANPEEFIMSSQVDALSDLERISIFKEIFDALDIKSIKPFNSPYYYLQTAISKIKDLKREAVSVDKYLELIDLSTLDEKSKEKNIDLQKIYKMYQEKLGEYKRYDFEDMINFVIDRFKKSPEFLRSYQERFQYFMVDEFQDTNSAQAELIYLLNSYEEWEDIPNLFVVGDDDQSVYRFQGASIENILSFYDRFPKSKIIVLRSNYRSNSRVVEASTSIIVNNKLRISNKIKLDKNQKSESSFNEPNIIQAGEFNSFVCENHFIVSEIKKLITEKNVDPSEIAVIYRNNADAEDIKRMLVKFGIKYRVLGGENVLNSGIIIRLLHLLRVIYKIRSNNEDLDLFTLLNYEFLNIPALDVLRLSRFASAKKINLFEALQQEDIFSAGINSEQKMMDFFNKIIEWNGLAANRTFIEFIEQVINESGFLNWILNRDDNFILLNKLNSFLSEIKRLNQSNNDLDLKMFLNYVELMYENKISITEQTIDIQTDAVNLLTAHKSKGLEFEYVFVPQFIDKKWSNAITRDLIKLPETILKSSMNLTPQEKKFREEEDDRRLFFVVLTRAKNFIYITSSKIYQTSKEAVPAMFLKEIDQTMVDEIDCKEYEKQNEQILRDLLKTSDISVEHTYDEKLFLADAIHGFKLSASSLNTYLECPYKFKLQFLFKTPKEKTKALSMGIAVHKALEESYKLMKENKPVPFDHLHQHFELALEKDILSELDKKEIKSEGLSILKVYYSMYEDHFNNPPQSTYFLEKFFGWGYSKPLLQTVHLQGKVDKIEILDHQKKLIKITDYKTGNPKTRNEIMGNTQYSKGDEYRQLLFYKLMVELDTSFKYKVHEIELDFIGNRKSKPKKESFILTDQDIEEFKKVVLDVSQKISELKFERTTNTSACENCDFRYHCWPDGIPANSIEQLNLFGVISDIPVAEPVKKQNVAKPTVRTAAVVPPKHIAPEVPPSGNVPVPF